MSGVISISSRATRASLEWHLKAAERAAGEIAECNVAMHELLDQHESDSPASAELLAWRDKLKAATARREELVQAAVVISQELEKRFLDDIVEEARALTTRHCMVEPSITAGVLCAEQQIRNALRPEVVKQEGLADKVLDLLRRTDARHMVVHKLEQSA